MELIVKVGNPDGPQTSYRDGDIIQTFSPDRILLSNAENICNVNNFPINSVTGLRENDSLFMKFLELKNTYKFERVNSNDVKRTNMITGEEEILNTTPNDEGEYINAYQFISRRLKSARHCIFGSSGSEIWYGKTRSSVDLDALWNDIETHTSQLKQNNMSWNFSPIEKRRFLVMNCCGHGHPHTHEDAISHAACINCTCGCDLHELSEDFANERIESVQIDGDPIIEEEIGVDSGDPTFEQILVAKRKFTVPYWDYDSLLSLDVDNIRNPNAQVDARKELDSRPTGDLLTVNKIDAGIIII
tara:strand:+ start:1051 stop:1956 length:906 start_codon:yes stop_codon:yes gene_type:complete